MSWLFATGGQSIRASASVLPVDIQGWFPLELTDLISLLSNELSRVQHHSWKVSVLHCSAFFVVQLSYLYWTSRKTIALTKWTLFGKVTSLLFNTLSRFVMDFPDGSDGKERICLLMWETWVLSLGWEDPLEEGITTHSSIFAWRIPMDRGDWQATVHGVAKSWTWLSN